MAEQQKTPEQLEADARKARLRLKALQGLGVEAKFTFDGDTYGLRMPSAKVNREALEDAKTVAGTTENEKADNLRYMHKLLAFCVVDPDTCQPVFSPGDWQALDNAPLSKSSFVQVASTAVAELLQGRNSVDAEASFTHAGPK